MYPKKNICNNIYETQNLFGTPVSVLIGAGLSVPSPSYLPLTPEIIKSLMNLDWFEGEEKFPITDSCILEKVTSKIRLEHMFSIFYEWKGHDPGKLINQFREAEPNWYHNKIAKLVRENIINRIFTTNFDLCIEKALTDQQIPFTLIADENDFSTADPNKLWVIKLHGTCSEDTQSARGLIATIESMAKEVEDWKIQCLSKSIDKNGLICLGYSGKDSFDINPILRQKTEQRILWIVHNNGSNNFSRINDSEITNTLKFSKFKEPVYIDTTTFLGKTRQLEVNTKEFHFNKVYSSFELCHPSVFLGRVLEYANEYEAAKKYYEKVFWASTGSNYWMSEIIDICRSIAVCNYELRNYEESQQYLAMAYALIVSYKNNVTTNGRTPLKLEEEIILEHELLLSEEFCLVYNKLNNIKSLEKEKGKLFQLLDKFENNYRQRPDIRSRILLNIASIHFERLKMKQASFKYSNKDICKDLEEACSIKEEIYDLVGLVKALVILGQIKLRMGKLDEATVVLLKCFNTIRKLNSSIEPALKELVVESVCLTCFYILVIGFCPVNKIPNFYKLNESLQNKFKKRVKVSLSSSLTENLIDNFFYALRKDSELINIIITIKRQLSEEKNYHLEELRESVESYGAILVTPDIKIEQYRNGLGGLKYMKDDPDAYWITMYGQYIAIGDEYRKAGDSLQATACYKIALSSLSSIPISAEFTNDRKKQSTKELEKTLAEITNKESVDTKLEI